MKRPEWLVFAEGIRPAGQPDKCFYCGSAIGDQHGEKCVIRSRTVLVKAEIEMLITVPEFWEESTVEFSRNEGSWCADNLLSELEDQAERMGCLCNSVRFSFVREATETDEEFFGLRVEDLPS